MVTSQKKIDARLAKTDAKLAETSAKIDRVSEMVGGISNNQGKIAEEFFYNSLQNEPILAGKRFDLIDNNPLRTHEKIREEYDLILYNGDSVFIIEVKYRVHLKDIETLIHRKGGNFPLLFPQYRDFQQHLGLATFSIEDDVLQEALSQGVTILQRYGDVIETTPVVA
ncbi:MAG: hypothetical protein CL915_07520 [Deltaproteobacteria bacterium]|nr:hypothetical protein [Deltaproteobacteria bacterium]